jgi:hypothetical protein
VLHHFESSLLSKKNKMRSIGMIKSTPAFRFSPWLQVYPFQAPAPSPKDTAPLRPAVVMLLALVFAFCNSHLFAQRYNYEKRAEKSRNPITSSTQSIISRPLPVPGAQSAFGLGAGDPGLFFSPNSIGWGLGPSFTPSAVENSMPTDSLWGDGPAVVAVRLQGPLFVGALVSNWWPSADSSETNITPTLVQPFIHYNLPSGWYVNAITTSTGEMCGLRHVSTPVGPSLGVAHCFGDLPVNLQWGAYYNNAQGPDEVPGWQLRFLIQFPFSY